MTLGSKALIGLLLAMDPLPNAFRTVANVTGMMAVTVLAGGTQAPASIRG